MFRASLELRVSSQARSNHARVEVSHRRAARKRNRWAVDPYWASLAVVVALGATLLTLSLWFPNVAVASNILGSAVGIAGSVWFIVIAFSEDNTEGMLCLLIPCYTLIYFVKNIDETKRAFLLQVTGWAISTASTLIQLWEGG